MKHQHGYMDLGGAVAAFAVACLAVGAIAAAALIVGVPWLWGLIRPWLHVVTGG